MLEVLILIIYLKDIFINVGSNLDLNIKEFCNPKFQVSFLNC